MHVETFNTVHVSMDPFTFELLIHVFFCLLISHCVWFMPNAYFYQFFASIKLEFNLLFKRKKTNEQ